MKCLKLYKDQNKKREYIRRNKERYYKSSQETAYNSRSTWTEDDIIKIIKHDIPDRELAPMIGRSVSAIQGMRHKIIQNALP